MKYQLGIAILLLSTSLASAECSVVATNDKGGNVYQCEPPVQASAPVKCRYLNDVLLCTGEIGQEAYTDRGWVVVKPSNCGWRKGKYICWN